jgi:putative tricarboxylic transport membrane protein
MFGPHQAHPRRDARVHGSEAEAERSPGSMAGHALSIVCVILAAVYFVGIRQIPELGLSDPLGPRAFPYILTVGLVVCAALLFLEGRREPRPDTRDDPIPRSAESDTNLFVFAISAAWIGGYFLLFERLGFIVATILFLLGATAYANRGHWGVNLATSVLLPIGAYVLLGAFLGVPLPAGVLSFLG